MVSWFDTHAHLSDPKFDPDRPEVVQRAFSAGVQRIIEIADGPSEWLKAQTLSRLYPGQMWWAAGFHPYYADQLTPETLAQLEIHTADSQFVAIGEVGLDYAKSEMPKDVQIDAFIKTLHLSAAVQKPLIIHCRDAFADLIPLLKKELKPNGGPPGVIHCFLGTLQDAKSLIDMGFFLGFDAPISYPKSEHLRQTLRQLPLEHIVLETDSPYLPPQTHRGQRNESSYLAWVGRYFCDVVQKSAEGMAPILWENSHRLFRLKP